MRINWTTERQGKQTIHRARVGSIHIERAITKDRNAIYWLYTLVKGRRVTLLRVHDNPAGPDQIDARLRSMFVAVCLENFLDFELLDIEKKESVEFDLTHRPKPGPLKEIHGRFINRIYRYTGHRGTMYYRVFSVMNTTAKTWDNLIGYRNIFSGEEYGRPMSEFTHEKYELLPHNTLIPNTSSFKFEVATKEAVNA